MKTKEERKIIEDHLQSMCDRAGRLTPDMVVEDAKKKSSPLHAEFEWDVRKAAAAHWVDRAREIIASVTVVIRTNKVDVRSPAYVRDPSCASHEQGYVSVDRLRTDQDASRIALMAEFSRVGDYLRRARNLAVALELHEDVDRIISGVAALRSRVELGSSAVN
jgi:hypothetical protein